MDNLDETSPPIILLYVEDDARLGRLTSTYLQCHNVIVHLIPNGEQALRDISQLQPDVVLLDVMLPGMNGYQVCKQIRRRLDVPIIMISAMTEEVDRILGLEFGADDYITKPFSTRELLARIRSQARRARGALISHPTTLTLGDLIVDEVTHTASLRGTTLSLTSHEFALLSTFAHRAGRILTRHQLITLTRGRGDEVFDRAIDVQISRLRQKLGDNPRNPTWIKTIRGVGYMFTPDNKA